MLRFIRIGAVASALLVGVAACSSTPDVDRSDPEAVAKAYAQAGADEDWDTIKELCDPEYQDQCLGDNGDGKDSRTSGVAWDELLDAKTEVRGPHDDGEIEVQFIVDGEEKMFIGVCDIDGTYYVCDL